MTWLQPEASCRTYSNRSSKLNGREDRTRTSCIRSCRGSIRTLCSSGTIADGTASQRKLPSRKPLVPELCLPLGRRPGAPVARWKAIGFRNGARIAGNLDLHRHEIRRREQRVDVHQVLEGGEGERPRGIDDRPSRRIPAPAEPARPFAVERTVGGPRDAPDDHRCDARSAVDAVLDAPQRAVHQSCADVRLEERHWTLPVHGPVRRAQPERRLPGVA